MSAHRTEKSYYLYIIRCASDQLYTGYTTDIIRRYREHLLGSNKCKFTRSFKPIALSQYWRFNCSLSEILQAEKLIKKLSSTQKKALIHAPCTLDDLLQARGLHLNCQATLISHPIARPSSAECQPRCRNRKT